MNNVSPFLMPKMKGVIIIGRKLKLGIDYYAMSVKHLQELRIDELNSKAGIKGLMIVELFNMVIYENGYYLKFDSIDYLIRLVSKSFYYDRLLNEEIRSIIELIIQCKIFDSELFNKGVLTSKEIQEHYYLVTRSRKERDFSLYFLLTEDDIEKLDKHSNLKKIEHSFIFTGNNPISTSENEIITSESTQSKSKSKSERDKKDKYDKMNFEIPNLHYLTKSLLKNNYIDNFDLDIMKYNNLFKELVDEYGFDKVCSCSNYIVRYSKRPSTDIDDKYDYFKASINKNLKMLERRENNNSKSVVDWFTELVKLNKY